MKHISHSFIYALALILITAFPLTAQEIETDPGNEPETETTAAPERAQPSMTIEDLAQQVELLREENQRIASGLAGLDQNKLRIYGYVTISAHKLFYRDNYFLGYSYARNHSGRKSYFTVTDFNIYLDKKIDRDWRFMSEAMITYRPAGVYRFSAESGYTEGEYVNTTYDGTDPVKIKSYNLSSIILKRLWIEYQPRDYFGIRVGRYLTPYGIWNVEGGAPVVLSIHDPTGGPYDLTTLPMAQTGIMFKGDFYATESIDLQYALTISNGDGPANAILDYDENKALGARLRAVYDSDPLIGLGCYVYQGDSTTVEPDIDNEYGLFGPILAEKESITKTFLAADLLFEYAGFRLQSEYLWGKLDYDDDLRSKASAAGEFSGMMPDYNTQGFFALLSYRLPLESVTLSPYVMWEHYIHSFWDNIRSSTSTAGLNWRITDSVVWKAEIGQTMFIPAEHDEAIDQRLSFISTALTASF